MPYVRLLGTPAITFDGRTVEPPADLRHALLLYLAHEGGWVLRDDLLYLFWPDAEEVRARANLRQLILTVRNMAVAPGFEVEKTRVRWHVDTDLRVWRRHLQGSSLPHPSEWPAGELLQGFRLTRAPEFDTWLELERAALSHRLRTLVLGSSEQAANDGRPHDALRWLDAWLNIDPLDEEAVQATLRIGGGAGIRARAVARYQEYARRLAQDFGGVPDSHTQGMAESLVHYPPTDDGPTLGGASRLLVRPGRWRPIVGRDGDVSAVMALLTEEEGAVVTLLAMGGMGKTRLALEVCRVAENVFPDGAHFVPLVFADKSDQVVAGIHDVLGLAPDPLTSQWGQIASHLSKARALIVLDNLEQLSDADLMIDQLHDAAPGVSWLLTSRRRLHAKHEVLYELGGLAFPVSDADRPLESFGAVQLLVSLAKRSCVHIDLGSEGSGVARLCRLVEGMPLALELAAGWLRVLPVGRVADDVEQGIEALVAADTSLDSRHASIEVVFEASWAALTPAERDALLGLAVFRGGYDDNAALAVAGVGRPLLLALRNRSFLGLEQGGRIAQHPLLETYVRAKAAMDPTALELSRERHARYYLGQLARYDEMGQEDGAAAAENALIPDHANFEAAWEFALNAGAADHTWWSMLEAGGATFGLSYLAAGRPLRWGELLRSALGVLPRDSPTWAVLESHEASFGDFAGRHQEAYRRRSEALRVLRSSADPTSVRYSLAWVLLLYGQSARSCGLDKAAREAFAESWRTFQDLGRQRLGNMALEELVLLTEDVENKEALYAEAITAIHAAKAKSVNSPLVLDRASFIAHTYGEFAPASALVVDLIAEGGERLRFSRFGPDVLKIAAELNLLLGDLEEAKRHVTEAIAEWPRLREVFPNRGGELGALLATIEHLRGETSRATEILEMDRAAASTPFGLLLRSAVALAGGEPGAALGYGEAAALAAASRTTGRTARRLTALAHLYCAEAAMTSRDVTSAEAHLGAADRIIGRFRFLPLAVRGIAIRARTLPATVSRTRLAWCARHPAAEWSVRRSLGGVVEPSLYPAQRDALWQDALTLLERTANSDAEDDMTFN